MKLTISTRLTIWYSLLLLLALSAFGILSFVFISKELFDEQLNVLGEDAEEISEFIHLKDGQLDLNYLTAEAADLNLKENGIFFEVWAAPEAPALRSRNFPPFLQTSFTKPPDGLARHLKDDAGAVFHVFTYASQLETPNGDVMIHIRVGQSVLYVTRLLDRIRRLLLMLAPLSLVLAGLGGWALARRSLKPVAAITDMAQKLSLGRLDRRLPEPEQNDELRQLVRTFNAMIERIQSGVGKIRQFTADASHELRTPLTILQGEIEVTLRKPREKSEYMATLHSNLKEIYWMEKIVNDLLLLSRADAGELALHKQQTDLAVLVGECLQTHGRPAGEKNISFHFQSPADPIKCAVDADRMRQVINNVLDNAVKYTPAGGDINISIIGEARRVILTVEDNGIGIPQKDIPFVFDRFYRVDTSRSREQHSSGLGLSICKWIVEAHGGRIKISSKEGEGTTVRIYL